MIAENPVYDFSHIHFSKHLDAPKWSGFCVDIGAPRSVVGRSYLSIVLQLIGEKSIPRMSSANYFRFGDTTVKSLGMIEIDLRVPSPRRSIPVLMDIVPVDIPALMGLDVLDSESLYADNVTNRLVHRFVLSSPGQAVRFQDVWHVPLLRYDGHLYAQMEFPTHTFYTSQQFRKFHKQFAHPSAAKLYNLLKRAGLESVDSKTLEQLKDIAAKCEPPQKIRNAPRRFRLCIGQEHVRFNARIYMDIMYIDGRPVLHIVGEATRFSAARFLPRISTDSIWEVIIMCWSSIYTGVPQ